MVAHHLDVYSTSQQLHAGGSRVDKFRVSTTLKTELTNNGNRVRISSRTSGVSPNCPPGGNPPVLGLIQGGSRETPEDTVWQERLIAVPDVR